MPGLIILWLLDEKPNIKELPVYFVTSLIIWSIVSGFAYYNNLRIAFVAGFFFTLNSILVLALAFKRFRQRNLSKPIPTQTLKGLIIALIAIFIVYSATAFIFKTNYGSDGPFHFAHVGNMISQNKIINEEAMVIIKDESSVYPGYRDNSWYVIWGTIAKTANEDSRAVANYLNPLLFILSILSLVYLTTSLKDKEDRELTLAFLTTLFGMIAVVLFRPIDGLLMYFPNRIGYLILLPAITGIYINYLKESEPKQKRIYLIIGALGTAASASLHNMAFIYVFALCSTYALLRILQEKDKKGFIKKNVFFFSLATITAVPFFLIKLDPINTFNNYVVEEVKNYRYIYLTDKLYIYYFKVRGIFEYGIATLIAILAGIYLYFKKTKFPKWLILFFAGLLLVIFIRENPFVIPIATKFISDTYVNRLVFILPTIIVFSFSYYHFFLRKVGERKSLLLLSALLIILIIFPVSLFGTSLRKYRESPDLLANMNGVAQYINNNLPQKSRIAADREIGYEITARANVRTLAVQDNHAAIFLGSEYKERLNDIARLFEPKEENLDPVVRSNTLKKYDTKYILVAINSGYIKRKNPDYDGKAVINSLSGDSDYKLIYSDKHYYLYEYEEL